MQNVKIYLKTMLFSIKTNRHDSQSHKDPIPPTTMILEGEIIEKGNGGFVIDVTAYYSEQHKQLEAPAMKLFIPTSKIDHIRIID